MTMRRTPAITKIKAGAIINRSLSWRRCSRDANFNNLLKQTKNMLRLRLSEMSIEEVLEFKRIHRYSKFWENDRVVYVIDHSLSLMGLSLTRLPNLNDLVIRGGFDCSRNLLASLRGSPREVSGSFFCDQNPRLHNLHGLSTRIGGKIVTDFGIFDSLAALTREAPLLLSADFRKPKARPGFIEKLRAITGWKKDSDR